MNEMYSMSILTHNIGVLAMLGIISINAVMLFVAEDIKRYAKKMRIFMPIGAGLIATILFTGAVMMAAKRLGFSLENLLMIVFGVALIILEAKRYSRLKHFNIFQDEPMQSYRTGALKILQIEALLLLPISIWMWI